VYMVRIELPADLVHRTEAVVALRDDFSAWRHEQARGEDGIEPAGEGRDEGSRSITGHTGTCSRRGAAACVGSLGGRTSRETKNHRPTNPAKRSSDI